MVFYVYVLSFVANLHFLVLYIKRISIFVFLPFSFFVLCFPLFSLSFFTFIVFWFFVFLFPLFPINFFLFSFAFCFLFSIFFYSLFFFPFSLFYCTIFDFPFLLFHLSLLLIRSGVIMGTTYGSQGTLGYSPFTL